MASMALAGALVGGGILQAKGILQQGREQKRAADFNANLLEEDARILAIQADQKIFDLERRANILRGETVASAFGSGTTASGSVAARLAEQAINTSIDRVRLQFNRDFGVQRLETFAKETRRRGRVAVKQSQLAALGAALGAGTGAAILGAGD